MQSTLEKLGDAQGKMILATMENKPELVEHYKNVQIEIVEDMALNKAES